MHVLFQVGKALLLVLSLGVGVYAGYAYGVLPLGSVVDPALGEKFRAHALGIYMHVFASIFAIVLGPLQFSSRMRRSLPRVHRWIGRLYLFIGVLLGGLSGLYMATLASGGYVARFGFGLLALSWLYTGYRAYSSIRQRHIEEHQRWMIRNYALTFSAVTLRIYLPVGMIVQVPYEVVYPLVAWLCWLPSLLTVEWFIRRNRGSHASLTPAYARSDGRGHDR